MNDERPLEQTATSPGVCNAGGGEQNCFDTDQKLIADLQKLATDLSGSIVPPEFAQGNETLHKGITDDIQGLSDRDDLIETQNDNATLTKSNREIEDAQQLFNQMGAEFKGPQLPPNPFK